MVVFYILNMFPIMLMLKLLSFPKSGDFVHNNSLIVQSRVLSSLAINWEFETLLLCITNYKIKF
jgi:hypothetical protein